MIHNLIITPNRRLARYYHSQAREALSWQDWLLHVWQHQAERFIQDTPKRLLSSLESQVLWQQAATHYESAKQAQGAAQLLTAWHIAMPDVTLEKEEVKQFMQWFTGVEAELHAHDWIETRHLADNIVAAIKAGALLLPETIYLRGFDEYSPQQQHCWDALQAANVQIETEDMTLPERVYQFYAFEDEDEECLQAALFAKRFITDNPHKQVGIVIPNIQDCWQRVHDIYEAVFEGEPCVNISAGLPLAHTPIVNAAIQALREAQARMSDAGSYLPSEWIAVFHDILTQAGWPGEHSLVSEAYQSQQRFADMLTDLAGLDALIGQCSYDVILHTCIQSLSHTMFQPESKHKPIQVLGVLEAAGIAFDATWVLGMTQDDWPGKPSPHPFLPYQLQVKHHMPHASFEREHQFSQALIHRLKKDNVHLIFSYARHGGEHSIERMQTTLLPPASPFEAGEPFMDLQARLSATVTWQARQPLQGLPLSDTRLKGGSGFFRAMADCPFKAYARYRLHAKKVEQPYFGLSPMERGILLHGVMERAYRGKKTLSQTPPQHDTIEAYILSECPTLTPAEVKLEAQRLHALCLDWMALDAKREAFRVVAVEHRQTTTFDGLTFTLVIDRVDETESGICLLDYKTGRVNTHNDVQLPLYAVASGFDPHTIIWAVIRKNEMAINQVVCDDKTDWVNQLHTLSQQIKSGDARVAPQHAMACHTCEYQGLCRINEHA